MAERTDMVDLSSWPNGMRLIVRRERPHPGAQLRFTDLDGHRFTCFATTTRPAAHTELTDVELRHRRRARCDIAYHGVCGDEVRAVTYQQWETLADRGRLCLVLVCLPARPCPGGLVCAADHEVGQSR